MTIIKTICKIVIFLLIVLTVSYIFGLGYISNHENIHAKIFKTYGIESQIKIDYWLSGSTIPESYNGCNDYCLMQHRNNDIVGYNTIIIIFTLWAIFLCYLLFKVMFENENK